MSHLTPAAFARQKDVNKSTVSRWIKSGRIRLDEAGRIDPVAAEQRLIATASPYAHHEARATQHGVAGAATPAAPYSPPAAPTGAQGALPLDNPAVVGVAIDDATLRLKQARAKREEAEAERASMELAQAAKELIPRAAVEFVLDDIGRTTASLLDRLADRYAPAIASCGGDIARIHAVLTEAARDFRVELAHHMTRKAGEIL